MIRFIFLAWIVALSLLMPSVVQAQASGPSAGSKMEPLKVLIATGGDAGQEVDVVASRNGKPTVYLFVQAETWDRPVARFIKTLDQELNKDRKEVAIFAVWLTDDVEKTKEYLPKADESMKLAQTTLAAYRGDKNGPPAWSIQPGAHLTVVVAAEGRVVASFGYRSVNETNVPEVLEKINSKK
jgi:hypothetical protein